MKTRIFLTLIFVLFCAAFVSAQNTPEDGDWTSNREFKKNTAEAEYMIRIGDIDNMNFGWPDDFNPFCGLSTPSHDYPWDIDNSDTPGTDRILLGTSFDGSTGADGYSDSYGEDTKPIPILIDLKPVKGIDLKKVTMQIFIDDFQSPEFGSCFTATVNGKRFVAFERILKDLNQSGPIGKLVTVDVPDELLPEFSKESVSFLIDDNISGIGDGYAIDFIKFLFNPVPKSIYSGNVSGIVYSEEDEPKKDVRITLDNSITTVSGSDGTFKFKDVIPGFHVLNAYYKGYKNYYLNIDVVCSETTELDFSLELSVPVVFNGKEILEGENIILSKIEFEKNSSELLSPAKTELEKIYNLLEENENIIIELSGYTSSEGDASVNKNLSLKRVETCKQYIVNNGISANRIFTVGMGSQNPIAPNDTEENRAKNRRVEFKIVRM